MSEIKVIRQADEQLLVDMGVENWDIWNKEKSTFPWCYEQNEICYFIQGEVIVTPQHGSPLKMGKGDLVTFPAGMSCEWKIVKDVKKYYRFQ